MARPPGDVHGGRGHHPRLQRRDVARRGGCGVGAGRVERRHIATWAVAAVSAFIIMWPVLDDARANAEARGNRYRPDFPRLFVELILGWNRWAVAITAALIIAGIVVLGRQSLRRAAAVCGAGAVVISVVLFVWLMLQPFDLYGRFFVSIVPFLAILAGIGVTIIPRIPAIVLASTLGLALLPGVRDTLDIDSPIRDTAALVARARYAGYGVCGRSTEALVVYTAPLPFSDGLPDDECDLLITVFSLTPEQVETASRTYQGRISLGGSMTLWAPADIQQELGVST